MITNPIVSVYTASKTFTYVAQYTVTSFSPQVPLLGNPPEGSPAVKLTINATTVSSSPQFLIKGFDANGAPVSETLTIGLGNTPTVQMYAALQSVTLTTGIGTGVGSFSIITSTPVIYGTGNPLIALDSIAMSGITVQSIVYAGTGGGSPSVVKYGIDASLQPLYAMPVFSGSVTGGIVQLPPPVNNTPYLIVAKDTTGSTSPKFFPGSFATLNVVITTFDDSANKDASLTVIVQQMPAVTR